MATVSPNISNELTNMASLIVNMMHYYIEHDIEMLGVKGDALREILNTSHTWTDEDVNLLIHNISKASIVKFMEQAQWDGLYY